uniref:Putative ovule protein n=1 Tax=Solanum chacoense TaxID=4108 RepID=A0A0V0GKJ9_SOLCH
MDELISMLKICTTNGDLTRLLFQLGHYIIIFFQVGLYILILFQVGFHILYEKVVTRIMYCATQIRCEKVVPKICMVLWKLSMRE